MTRIERVTTAVVEANFDYTYVRIDSSDGVSGYGEAFFAPGLSQAIREIGSLLIGHDPTNVRSLVSMLRVATSASAGANGEGSLLHAISGIETALWDLTGKTLGLPVWQLIGGRVRESVPVYADLHAGTGLPSIDSLLRNRVPFWASQSGATEVGAFYWQQGEAEELDFERIVERVQAAGQAGFRLVKLDIDVFEERRDALDQTLHTDQISQIADRAARLRHAISPEVDIAYDCHWRFDVPSASRLHAELAAARPYWLEDPVNPTPQALARVAQAGSQPIASGENAYSLEGIVHLASAGGLDIATPDVQKVGGILEALAIADWTDRHGVGLAPHCIASPLGFVAAVQVLAAAPSVRFLEFHGSDLPFWADLVDVPVIVDGHAPVPDRPGLGVELNLEVARHYAKRSEPFFGDPAPESQTVIA